MSYNAVFFSKNYFKIKKVVFYLAYSLLSIQAYTSNMENNEFQGLKKGFLNSTPKNNNLRPKKEEIKQPNRENSNSLVDYFDEIFEEKERINNSLWFDNRIISDKKIRYQIYNIVGWPNEGINMLEENFNKLNQVKNVNDVCESKEFFRAVLRIWGLFNQNYNYYRYDVKKPNLLPFALQALVNLMLEAKFNYLATLSDEKSMLYRKEFITPDSNEEHGELIFYTNIPHLSEPFRYVREKLSNGKKIYRLVDLGFTKNLKLTPILGDNYLSYYSKGEIRYKSSEDTYLINHSAVILNKNMELVQKEGLVLTKGWLFSEDYHLVAYSKHHILDEMFFFEKELFYSDKDCSYLVKTLLNTVGGIEELDKRRFIFIPTDEDTISTMEARFLLPLFYEMKEIQKDHVLKIDWIPTAIDKLKDIIADDIISQPDENLDQEIVKEIVEEEIKQELANSNSQLAKELKELEDARGLAARNKNKKRKQKTQKHVFIKSQDIIDKAKKIKASEISKDEVKIRRKLKTLDKIEQEYINRTTMEKHFDTKDLHELLGDIMVDLKNKFGINTTGHAHAKGSHAAFEIVDPHTQQTTKLSVGKRPEKRGYQSGTVRTIVKDWIAKVEAIIQPQ